MSLRRTAISVHRWLGLVAALLWLFEATTGTMIVFHWEIDDLSVAGARHATDLTALAHRADAYAAVGNPVGSMWTSAGSPDRYDLFLANGDSVRVDGVGDVLRTRHDGERIADGGLMDTIVTLHQSLLAGGAGHWIIALSGILLVTNIVLGLIAGWPRGGRWRQALTPASPRAQAPRYYSWHRALGLWAGIPAAIAIACGATLAMSDALDTLAPPAAPGAPSAPTPIRVDLPHAVAIASARYPTAALSGVGFPAPDAPFWTVHFKQPGELVRAYGNSVVKLSAADGHIVQDVDALHLGPGAWLYDHLFAIHTGEFAGLPGRLAMEAIGVWLATMSCLGVLLWNARRRR